MTVLLDDASPDPGTHVLLIGVGHYPFQQERENPVARAMRFNQLSSPPVSVREMVNWFMDTQDGFNNPARPLRSIQVLCSAVDPMSLVDSTGQQQVIDKAKMPLVQQAILDWMDRASRNPENTAIFYFCGHGVAFGEAQNSLLLEEFGQNQNNPTVDAIAFDEMRLGVMRRCDAKHQIHLIDACRTPPSKTYVETYGANNWGIPIAVAGINASLREKIAPIYFATGLAATAYGLEGQPSVFTQGLLESMRGPASRDKDEHWEVQVPALAEGINKCVARMTLQALPQYCQPRDTGQELTLHRLRGAPEVVVKVFTRDLERLQEATLTHTEEDSLAYGERGPDKLPWWIALTSGPYRFEALSVKDKTVVLGRNRKFLVPPGAEVGL